MNKPNDNMPISKKAFGQAILPTVGDIIADCKVMYVKAGDFRFTAQKLIASETPMPVEGQVLEWNGKNYTVGLVDGSKKRYTASFTGFKNFSVPAPVEQEEEMVKLI